MSRLALLAALPVVAFVLHAATPPATIPVDKTPVEPWKPSPFIVPEGMEIEVVAAPPLVEHPMMGGFDDKGRLYLAEAVGENLKFDDLQKLKPNYVRRLEDTDGDGKFDKTTIFADKLEFPQGALWHDGALYVASPPSIWKFIDTDDDGVADQRIELVGKFGSNGNAADIHGCFLSPTGRIYWVDGYHGHDIDQHQQRLTGKASYIFSCRPDGKDIRVHCGGGMDNPTEIDWTPTGELIGDVNILLRNPRQDCLVHWLYGGSYPHREAAIAEFKITGDRLGPITKFGHVAVAGCIRLRSDHFGKEYQGSFLTAQFNTQKVMRSTLTRAGSTFTSQDVEFIKSTNPDMHITDVIEDADGSLLIIDTGGWFRIGCPTSQIAKPNLLGGIYRLKRTGAKPMGDPRGRKVAFDFLEPGSLVTLLDDHRWVVREKAITALGKKGDDAVGLLAFTLSRGSEEAKRNAIWSLTRIGTPKASAAILPGLEDKSESVRLAAVHAITETRDVNALPALSRMALTDTAPIRREAAVALGRIGQVEGVPVLFQSLQSPVDRTLEHAIIFALIEINHPQAVSLGLTSPHADVRRAALLALDQMDSSRLEPATVLPHLEGSDARMRETAIGIVTRRSAWVDAVNERLAGWLKGDLTADHAAVIQPIFAAYLTTESTRHLIGAALADHATSRDTRVALLQAVAAGSALELHPSWREPIRDNLRSTDHAVASAAVAAAAAIKTDAFNEPLKQLGSDAARPAMLRVAALRAIGGKSARLDGPAFDLLVSQLSPAAALEARIEAARMIGESSLTRPQLQALVPLVAAAGPLELPAMLPAFKSMDAPTGKAFIAALAASPGLPAVQLSTIKSTLSRLPAEAQADAAPLIQRLQQEETQKFSRLSQLESAMSSGDPARGKVLYDQAKGTCIACHRIKGVGGIIGPDLSQIGRIRQTRDLLEAIVFPSASFARSYEPWIVTLTDGQVLMGTIPTDSADAIEFMPLTGQAVKIPRKNIKSMVLNTVSLMPPGLDRTMTEAELADLVAYLKSLQ